MGQTVTLRSYTGQAVSGLLPLSTVMIDHKKENII